MLPVKKDFKCRSNKNNILQNLNREGGIKNGGSLLSFILNIISLDVPLQYKQITNAFSLATGSFRYQLCLLF